MPPRQVAVALMCAALSAVTAGCGRSLTDEQRGNNLLDQGVELEEQGNLEAAIDCYTESARIWTKLSQQGQASFERKLARSLNNRANALRSQGRMRDAIPDYNRAIEIRTNLAEREKDPETENSLAGSLTNRGGAYEEYGMVAEAIQDYNRAIALRRRLVELGNEEVKLDLALTLNNLAWLRATCPDEAFRDGGKAVEAGTEACELTGWTNYECLDTLAAACARAGDFASAVKRQQEALDQCPPEEKGDLLHRLDLYRAEQPFQLDRRAPIPSSQ